MTLFNASEPWWGNVSEDDLAKSVAEIAGGEAQGQALLAALREARPDYSTTYLRSSALTASRMFLGSVQMAERKAALGAAPDYPLAHDGYLARCHDAGQRRPTPLLLKYEAGDYNCLHQDLYGDLVFPLQVAFLLSAPGQDFTGGEFMLTEQRPRQQSRGEVVSLTQGEGVIFAVNHRPVQGKRGVYRCAMRHGVSRLKSGRRFTLGIIFHDAR